MTPEHFERLCEHLTDVDPILARFCREQGFQYAAKSSLGRYPRRRIISHGLVHRIFDLQMDIAPDGSYCRSASPDTPYSLFAGAWLDQGQARYSKGFMCFEARPFRTLAATLLEDLRSNLAVIDRWDAAFLLREGEWSTLAIPQKETQQNAD